MSGTRDAYSIQRMLFTHMMHAGTRAMSAPRALHPQAIYSHVLGEVSALPELGHPEHDHVCVHMGVEGLISAIPAK